MNNRTSMFTRFFGEDLYPHQAAFMLSLPFRLAGTLPHRPATPTDCPGQRCAPWQPRPVSRTAEAFGYTKNYTLNFTKREP